MDIISRLTDTLAALPDPLIYTFIAFGASGAVYSTLQHINAWRPRNAKRVKLKGADGRKIENCLLPRFLSGADCSVDFSESWCSSSEYKLQCCLCVRTF